MNKFLEAFVISALGLAVGSTTAWSQEKAGSLHYQGAVRDSKGLPVGNQQISVRVSLLDGSSTGPVLYWEINEVTTNAVGLYNFNIGESKKSSISEGKSFSGIDWHGDRPIYIKIEIDPKGGVSWSVPNISMLSAVPYSLYAEKGGTSG